VAVLKRDESNYPSDLNVHDVHTILGPESTFEGKLMFDGTVRIDGTFRGEVRTDNILVIGQTARVEAQIFVGSIVINGEVVGDITAKQSVEIHAPGKVRGNISTPQLMIAKGVVFEGTSKMEEALRGAATPGPGGKVTLLPGKDADRDKG
jgi:cytoskeletal protein CcmA (bactofilin family)